MQNKTHKTDLQKLPRNVGVHVIVHGTRECDSTVHARAGARAAAPARKRYHTAPLAHTDLSENGAAFVVVTAAVVVVACRRRWPSRRGVAAIADSADAAAAAAKRARLRVVMSR
jgi:hypothetical protein